MTGTSVALRRSEPTTLAEQTRAARDHKEEFSSIVKKITPVWTVAVIQNEMFLANYRADGHVYQFFKFLARNAL